MSLKNKLEICRNFQISKILLLYLDYILTILAYNVFIEHSTISKEGETAIKKFCQSTAFFIAVYLAGTAGFVWLEELWDEVNFIRQDPNDIFDINYLLKVRSIFVYGIFMIKIFRISCGLLFYMWPLSSVEFCFF